MVFCRPPPLCFATYFFLLPAGAAPFLAPFLASFAEAAATDPTGTHDFLLASHSWPFSPKLRSKATSFQRSSSESLVFQAFILVLGTPSAIRQNQTESE